VENTDINRPTFDPARGRDNAAAPTRAFHAKSLPAHTKLKLRRLGQTSESEVSQRDLRAELLAAEAEYRKKVGRLDQNVRDASETLPKEESEEGSGESTTDPGGRGEKRISSENREEDEGIAKRRKILEEARELDAESEEESSEERYCVCLWTC
jgi:protein CWC15